MKIILKYSLITALLFVVFSYTKSTLVLNKYKCLIQMKNYSGEGAYIVVSLIKPDGKYEKIMSNKL